jgi:HK97 gp10 family phage protein
MEMPMVKFDFPDIDELRDGFRALPKKLSAITQGAAVKRAMQPAVAALKANSPRGPTGNLARAVKLKTVRYPETGTGAAIVGYVKPGSGKSKSAQGGKVRKGSDRAFHQFWIEFGTKERRILNPSKMRGYVIASSYDSLGPFSLKRQRMVKGGRRVVQSSPKYPKAFFKAAPAGQALVLPAVRAQQPVARTWNQVRAQVTGSLEKELRQGLINARKQLEIYAAKRAAKLAAAGK